MKPRLYLSAPCSGYEDSERDEYFNKWQRYFESFGYTVFNPRRNGLDSSATWTEHMRRDIAELCSCDILVRISETASPGVNLEVLVALELNLKLVSYDEVLRYYNDAVKLDYLLS